MNRVFVACVALLGAMAASAPSRAADLPSRYARPYAPPPPVYSPIYNWTGFYLGINGGAGWGGSQWDGVDKFSVSGGLIGGTLGYNWQFGQLVAGIEGDIDWSGIGGSTNVNCLFGCETRNHWLGTARARVGYAFDRFLPYLTAGLAIGDIAATTPGWPAGSTTTAGWTIGAGIEFGIVSNVSIKAEYLFVDLGEFNCGLNCGLAGNGNVSFYSNLFRGGLNVRF
ncbi:MAG: porin family protein [Hyphomicrobiales bacterium]|nr:porin family protein [Hyphomicrobiales bacterium]